MVTIAPYTEVEEASNFTPLTAEQAEALRAQHPSISPWWVVAGQLVIGVLVALVSWGVTGSQTVGWSAACGALAVIVPAALFARGVTGQFAKANPGSAVLSFFVWELVKIVVTVGILFAAHRMVSGLSWPAMLIGLIVTMWIMDTRPVSFWVLGFHGWILMTLITRIGRTSNFIPI